MLTTRLFVRNVTQSRFFSSALSPATSHMISATGGLGPYNPAFHTLLLHDSHLTAPAAPALRIQIASKATLPRDPERPKLPLSAYLRFAAVFREKSSLKGGSETMRKIGEAWKNLSPVEKKPFEDIAANDKKIYAKKFEDYKNSGKLDAWKRDPAKPKKPITAYLMWSTERRKDPQLSKMPIIESSKVIAVEWKSLPQAEKDKLQSQYKSSMEKYNKEMEAYKASGSEEAWKERTGRLAVSKKAEEQLLKKKTKEMAAKEKDKQKAKLAKEKEKLKRKKENEKAAKAKAAAKKKADMERLKARKAKEAAKKKADVEKLRAAKAKEKEKEKEAKAKEKMKADAANAKKNSQTPKATGAEQKSKASYAS